MRPKSGTRERRCARIARVPVWRRIARLEAPREADDAEVPVELPVDGDADDGDDGSGKHRGEGFAGGVEGSGVDGLRGPEGEGDGEDGRSRWRSMWRRRVEGAAAEDEVDCRVGEGDHGGGAEE